MSAVKCRKLRPPCALIACGWLAAFPLHGAEPPAISHTRYDGRTLAEWRERISRIEYKSPDVGGEVPGLLAIAQDRSAPWFSRRQAALTLGRIGDPARSAIPELVKLLDEPPEIPEQSTRLWVIKALALFGPLAADTAPQLVAILEDDSGAPLPRLMALEALGRIGPAQPLALPAITRALDAGLATGASADARERAVGAAEVLELFRGQGAPATPSLIRATAVHDVLLRRAAANSLGQIGLPAEPAVPALADLVVFDESHEVRDLAARALGRIGGAAEPVLVQLLEDADAEVRVRGASACRELKSAAVPTIAALQTAVADSDPQVRIAALESLWAVSHNPRSVVPPAIAELSNVDRDIRMRSVRLLEAIGSGHSDWLPELRALTKSDNGAAAQAASRVLRTHGSPVGKGKSRE